MKMRKPLKIYTDGSSAPHKEKNAGWSVVFCFDKPYIMYGHLETPSTNIIAETLAVVYALEVSAKQNTHTIIYADCDFARRALTEWRTKWERTGFPTKNRDLIIRLFEAFDNHPMPEIRWVKGHADFKYNEIADTYAKYGRLQTQLPNRQFDVKYFIHPSECDCFVQKLGARNNKATT